MVAGIIASVELSSRPGVACGRVGQMEAFRALIRGLRAELPVLAFAGAVLLIGSNLVAIRFSNRELPPFWGAGTRFAIAAAMASLLTVSK